MVGIDFFGNIFLKSPSSSVRDITYIELQNMITDEIHIRNNINISNTNMRLPWQIDTIFLARFMNTLEAGNIENEGMEITQIAIKRRNIDDISSITLAFFPFKNNEQFEYIDYTQPNTKLIYSIVPISDQLEGVPKEIVVESDFSGWFVVDKNTNTVIPFDKMIDSNNQTLEDSLNQGRVTLSTLTKYPQIYYTPQSYHTFTLTGGFIGSDNEKSNDVYKKLLDLINRHIPLIVKGSNGDIYICDISQPKKSFPLNTWKGYDYTTITVECTEIMNLNDYMKSVVN